MRSKKDDNINDFGLHSFPKGTIIKNGGDEMLKDVEEKVTLIEGWARDGLSQKQIADNLGIGLTTLKDYRKKSPTISTALKKGREVSDYHVENALYQSAINGNVTAMIFWLKNRKPNEWKDKKEPAEIEIMKKDLELRERKLKLEEEKIKDLKNQFLEFNISIVD